MDETPLPNFKRLHEYRAEVDVVVFADSEQAAERAVKLALDDMVDRSTLQASLAVVRPRHGF